MPWLWIRKQAAIQRNVGETDFKDSNWLSLMDKGGRAIQLEYQFFAWASGSTDCNRRRFIRKDYEFNFGVTNVGYLWAGYTSWKFNWEMGLRTLGIILQCVEYMSLIRVQREGGQRWNPENQQHVRSWKRKQRQNTEKEWLEKQEEESGLDLGIRKSPCQQNGQQKTDGMVYRVKEKLGES